MAKAAFLKSIVAMLLQSTWVFYAFGKCSPGHLHQLSWNPERFLVYSFEKRCVCQISRNGSMLKTIFKQQPQFIHIIFKGSIISDGVILKKQSLHISSQISDQWETQIGLYTRIKKNVEVKKEKFIENLKCLTIVSNFLLGLTEQFRLYFAIGYNCAKK